MNQLKNPVSKIPLSTKAYIALFLARGRWRLIKRHLPCAQRKCLWASNEGRVVHFLESLVSRWQTGITRAARPTCWDTKRKRYSKPRRERTPSSVNPTLPVAYKMLHVISRSYAKTCPGFPSDVGWRPGERKIIFENSFRTNNNILQRAARCVACHMSTTSNMNDVKDKCLSIWRM